MADMGTQNYRFAELNDMGTTDDDMIQRVKFQSATGETKWMNISADEFEMMYAVLCPDSYREMLKKYNATGFRVLEDQDPIY